METLKAIALRKAVRAFKAEPIKKEELETIINSGAIAPVGMGKFDNVRLTVVQDREVLNTIAGKIKEYMTKIFPQAGDRDPLYNSSTFVIVSTPADDFLGKENAACAVENMCLAATDLLIGSVYIGSSVAINDPDLLNTLNIPEGFHSSACIALGYPVEPLTEVRDITQRRIEVNYI